MAFSDFLSKARTSALSVMLLSRLSFLAIIAMICATPSPSSLPYRSGSAFTPKRASNVRPPAPRCTRTSLTERAVSAGRHAAQSDRTGNRDAFARDQPSVERVGARGDRGECAQGAADWREPQERRSAGCADLGAAGQDRSRVAVSGEASQRAGASGSDDDSGTGRPGAGAHGAGQHGPRAGEVVRGALARLQCAQHGSGESRRTESGAATGTGAVVGNDRRTERTDRGVQRPDRSAGANALSASRVAEADQGRGHADRADLPADAGRSASFPQEPRRGRLSGTAAGPKKLGPERAAAAHQQRRRSVSAHAAGAGSAAYLGTVRDRL